MSKNRYMITPDEEATIKSIQKRIMDSDPAASTESWLQSDLLDDIVNRLKIASQSYRPASPEDIYEGYYTAYCERCGWFGSSRLLNGGDPIADTGDYDDCYCPVCGNTDIDEI